MSHTHPLALTNISYLEQGLDLLIDIGERRFAKPSSTVFGSGIGSHWRHCLDHYLAFLDGWSEGRIDYAARQRDPRIETDLEFAMGCARDSIHRLRKVVRSDGTSTLQVCVDRGEEVEESTSSVDRELQFLISHTVHHYALIAVIAKLEGYEPAPSFGVAPSTLKHQRDQTACAR